MYKSILETDGGSIEERYQNTVKIMSDEKSCHDYYCFFQVFNWEKMQKRKAFIKDGVIYVKRKRSRIWYSPLSVASLSYFDIRVEIIDKEKQWRKRWQKVLMRLQKSGFWPGNNRAWYSEEYRGCGNGYYYMALDTTHALFVEDD